MSCQHDSDYRTKAGCQLCLMEERDRLKAEVERLGKALKAISNRIDELETQDHRPVEWLELRGLQEEARAELGKEKPTR